MKLIEIYILREWSKTFFLALIALMGLVVLGVMYDDLPHLLEYGATGMDILHFNLYLIPSFIPLIIPIALLFSLLFTLGTLHHNNEITAMRALGLNLFAITRSLWIAALVLAVVLFILNANIVPYATEKYKNIENSLRIASETQTQGIDRAGMINKIAFDNTSAHRLWFINCFSEGSLKASGINIYQRNEGGHEVLRILAREGFFDEANKQWVFFEGRETEFNDLGEPVRSQTFEKREFPEFTESPTVMVAISKKPRHLSFNQVKSILSAFDYRKNQNLTKYAIKYHETLVSPISCIIVAMIAIPFAISGVRTNPLVGVSKAMVLFVAYYFILNISGIMGTQHMIVPWLAAWFPNIISLIFALTLYRKMV